MSTPPSSSSSSISTNPISVNLTATELNRRLASIRARVAQPFVRGFADPQPALLRGGVLIGNKYHAADVANLVRLGVTAVLNCASGGISRLPVDQMEDQGIRYAFTNVRQDHYEYPILHHATTFQASDHLQVARQLYQEVVVEQGGKILFFCVAGMNRSTCLGIAALMLFGYSLDEALDECARQRPFVLENQGFQVQLVQLEALLRTCPRKAMGPYTVYAHGAPPPIVQPPPLPMMANEVPKVEIELLIPGLCTMDVQIPMHATIATVKQCLIEHANQHLLRFYHDGTKTTTTNNNNNRVSNPTPSQAPRVAKSWLVLAMFGYDSMYDVPLEVEAIDKRVQLDRIQNMFGLKLSRATTRKRSMGSGSPTGRNGNHSSSSSSSNVVVEWNQKCRFALVIFSVYNTYRDAVQGTVTLQQPWTFLHEERPGAPATFLENNLLTTHLRAWDFVTGQAYASEQPIVFSYSSDARDRRGFMKISTSANQAQQFHAPGEGGILGMGANAIVHRVQLKPTSLAGAAKGKPPSRSNSFEDDLMMIAETESKDEEELSSQAGWDAAVKRHFSLEKMLASLENSSEAGLAKRVRLANSLNPGRVLYFYGLGVCMSANMTSEQAVESHKLEYRWEAILLARYEAEFSTYTMKRFMEDYIAVADQVRETDPARAHEIERLQQSFSLVSVKILLVSLLNAFRDLTLMGVQAFDFNHLSNVLISRDHRNVRLIDIDGNSKGSVHVEYPGQYSQSGVDPSSELVHKPSLDIDLNAVLPTVIQQLLLGKGRGVAFVTNTKSEIWHAPPEKAKEIIVQILWENFYPHPSSGELSKIEKHLNKMAEWFYAVLKKQAPWTNWTVDVYDAMRCIDHLPIA